LTNEHEELKQQVLEDLEKLRAELEPYRRFYGAMKRFQFWSRMMLVTIMGQLGAIVYDMTLPVYQSLWIPFSVCWFLAFIGSFIPRLEIRALKKESVVAQQKARDDHYKALTGTDRR